jgi:hypothetical protein
MRNIQNIQNIVLDLGLRQAVLHVVCLFGGLPAVRCDLQCCDDYVTHMCQSCGAAVTIFKA